MGCDQGQGSGSRAEVHTAWNGRGEVVLGCVSGEGAVLWPTHFCDQLRYRVCYGATNQHALQQEQMTLQIDRVLRRGLRGQDVTSWQHFLIGRGLLKGAADGIFGPGTESATIAYQKSRSLQNDGVVGTDTIISSMIDGFAIIAVSDDDFPTRPTGFNALPNNAARAAKFGEFRYRPLNNPEGEIEILGNWVEKNIVRVRCPIFKQMISLHKKVSSDYLAFMNEVIEAGLSDLLITYDGSFYPRFIRGSRTSLSNHSWGTAFDVNYEWNKLGTTPASKGSKGSVREIVEIGVKHGWFWGGWFSRKDGMHFEHT